MKTLHIALLVMLGTGIGLRAADVSDLTYVNNTLYVTITDCDEDATGALDIPATIEGVPVKLIGESAFRRCGKLTRVTIPDSVTGIGNEAFRNCTSLTSITIPDGVTSIGVYAFGYCSSLTSITIGNSVTSIVGYAFRSCSSLTSITIPESVTSIGASAFRSCSSLTSITIPDGVTSIGDRAFYSCSSLTSITFLGTAPTVGADAFSGVANGARALVTIVHLASFGDLGDDWNGLTLGMSDSYLNDLATQVAELSQRPTQASYDALGDALVAMTADRDARLTLAEVQDARVDSIVMAKDPVTGVVTLCFDLQKSDDFISWIAYGGGTLNDLGDGQFKVSLPLGPGKEWLRMVMKK
jgi:hypothetical protein